MDRLYRGDENLPETNISDDEMREGKRDRNKENKDALFCPRHPTLFVQWALGVDWKSMGVVWFFPKPHNDALADHESLERQWTGLTRE